MPSVYEGPWRLEKQTGEKEPQHSLLNEALRESFIKKMTTVKAIKEIRGRHSVIQGRSISDKRSTPWVSSCCCGRNEPKCSSFKQRSWSSVNQSHSMVKSRSSHLACPGDHSGFLALGSTITMLASNVTSLLFSQISLFLFPMKTLWWHWPAELIQNHVAISKSLTLSCLQSLFHGHMVTSTGARNWNREILWHGGPHIELATSTKHNGKRNSHTWALEE